MRKLVKFLTPKEVLDDAEVLATIVEDLLLSTVKIKPTAKEHLESADWLGELLRHVVDSVPGLELMSPTAATGISIESSVRELNASLEFIYKVIETGSDWTLRDDNDDLRAMAAAAYVSAGIAAKSILETPSYQDAWLAELRTYEAGRLSIRDERNQANALLN